MSHDDYSIRCKVCGRQRGNHYSRNNELVFCSHKDLKVYMETGVTGGKRFKPVKTLVMLKPEITERSTVVMNGSDPWAVEGQIGVVMNRQYESAKIRWNDDGGIFIHSIGRVSLLKGAKDPNLLFCIAKQNQRDGE